MGASMHPTRPESARRATRTVIFGLALTALAGCAAVAPPPYAARHAAVPPGHMPPPVSCRVWYPDRPPGQQPPPGRCDILHHHVPPGAYLVYGG